MDCARHTSPPEIRYQDFELVEKVEQAVRKRLHSGATHLLVEGSDEGVVLRGYVRTYYEKQLAQNEALHVVGAGRLRDELQVI